MEKQGLNLVSGKAQGRNPDEVRHMLVRSLINLLASDLLAETDARIRQLKINSLEDVRKSKEEVFTYSPALVQPVTELREYLYQELYCHERLVEMSSRAKRIVEGLYQKFSLTPELMPSRYREMLQSEEKVRVVADYVAGMTDRYAEKTYAQLCT